MTILTNFKGDSQRIQLTALLAATSVFCLFLSIARFVITGSGAYLFLNWNLFLAFVPWLISTLLSLSNPYSFSKAIYISLIFCWLFFFPNLPYILTDLFHLRREQTAPIWFDLILILSYGWAGLLYGFISLMDIEALGVKYIKNSSAVVAIRVFILFLSAFGVYLGRFLRWDTWDLIQEPLVLVSDILDRFANPLLHPRTWAFTILTGILLNIMYLFFKLIQKRGVA